MNKKEEKAEEHQLSEEERIELLRGAVNKQFVSQLILPILFLLTLTSTLFFSTYLTGQLKILDAESPEHLYVQMEEEISDAKKGLEAFFAPYHEQLNAPETRRFLKPSVDVLTDAIREEKALISLLENQRAAIFNLASNISGSGEWHRFYRRNLGDHIDHAKSRMVKLNNAR